MTVLKPSISRPRAEPDADPPARTESRRRERNLLKELPFWNLDGGVVELRNRVLEVGFELILPDSDFISAEGLHELSETYLYVIRSCTPDRERFRMIAEINPAIENPLDDYLAGVTTTNPQLRDLVQSRYQMQNAIFEAGGVRQWRIHCSCSLSTFKAPGMQPFSEDEWVKVLEEALNLRDRFITAFIQAGIQATPMGNQQTFDAIWRTLNLGLLPNRAPRYKTLDQREIQGLSRQAVKRFPELTVDTLRHQLCQSEIDNENPNFLRVGSRYVASLAMRGLPDSTIFGRINSLFPPTGSMLLVTDIAHPNQAKSQRALMNAARWALGMAKGMARSSANRQVEAVEEMQAMERHIVTVACTALIVADTKDELKKMKLDVAGQFEKMSGMVLAADGFDTAEQYFKCLPFSGRSSKYPRTTFDITAKNFLPTVSPWRGSRRSVNVCANRYGGFVPFDLLDDRAANQGTVVLGGTRTGKSFGFQSLVMGELARGDELVVLDRGNSWDELVYAAGGGVTEITPGLHSINPFELDPGQLVPDPAQAQVMANIMEAMLTNPTGDMLSLIPHAIAQTFELSHYESAGEHRQSTVLMRDIVRRFEMMNRIGERSMGDEERRIALALSRDLQGWMGESPLGQFVDRPSTVDLRAKVLSFETKNIAEAGGLQKVGMMILANLLMRWMMRDKSQRKRVVVEELKALTDTPQAIRTTVSLFATAAKYNTAMTVLNQGASIFADPALNSVLNNASIFLLFRLDREEANIIGERLMLPDTVVNELPRLKKVDGLYSEVMAIIRRSDGVLEGGVLRLQASPLEYWHYTSGKDDRGPREEAIVRHGGNRRAALLELASDWKVVL